MYIRSVDTSASCGRLEEALYLAGDSSGKSPTLLRRMLLRRILLRSSSGGSSSGAPQEDFPEELFRTILSICPYVV